ncbi:alpha/beta hydrolase [Halomonas nitroreducens]|uniref:Alpha/beta hydrolase n=1 Tax=Halomonas nitroreducens TaxID=447425 RepID=A0A3S0KTH2_9GAMM|nr:alpha/beta hydrolase [Halomonas nitroreducens]RTR06916.1 alpha/beta hydrolase [Halomonas nitroreducens]
MAMTTLRAEAPLPEDTAGAREAAYRAVLVALLGRLKEAGRSPAALRYLMVRSPGGRLNPRAWACDRLWREVFGGFKPADFAVEATEEGRIALVATLDEPPVSVPDEPAVWHGLTASQVNAAYSARAAVPDHLAIFQRWREEGERFLADHEVRRELAYGKAPEQRLDFFPASRPNAPLLVFLHGGYWQAMDKAEHCQLFGGMLEAGWAVALLNYRLCPEVTIADQVDDVRAALRHLWHAAERLGFDRERIQVSGHSAGGHLGACLVSTDWPALDPTMPATPIHSALLVSGLYELEPMRHMSFGPLLGLPDTETARTLSPMFATPNPGLRLHLAVGERESEEFHWQSRALGRRWAFHLDSLEVASVPGTHHFSVMETLADGDLLAASRALMTPAT